MAKRRTAFPARLRWLVCVLTIAGCVEPVVAAAPPAWWNDPIKEDPGHYFFTATGASNTSADEALQQAQKNALEQIVDRVGGGSADVRRYLLTRIRGWKLHARDDKKDGRTDYVWIIVKYPKDEYKALGALVGGGDTRYAEAVRLAEQHQWQQALAMLDILEKEYPLGMQPLFRTEKAILLAGQCYEGMDQYQNAKETYERLLNTISDPTVRKTARTALERARRKLPDQVAAPTTALSRTSVLDLLAAQKYLSALSMAELLIEKDGQNPEALELIARSHAGLGNLDNALEYYTLAVRSAPPATFRVVRVKAQDMASQVFAAQCLKLLRENEGVRKSWALLLDPSIKDDPDLASFVRGFQAKMAQAGLKMAQKDWLLFEEWLRASNKKPHDLLADGTALKAACSEAGVELADMILLVAKGPGSNKAKAVVQGSLYGAARPTSVAVDVIISQVVTAGATLESALDAVAEERLDEAATWFDQMGNKEYAALLRDMSALKRTCKGLNKGAAITAEIRTDFERSCRALASAVTIWLPQSETDKRLSQLIMGTTRHWIDGVEADFTAVGGNKRDLISVLNRCRELDKAMNLLPLEQRQPNAVQAYTDYAEKYRACPSWAISKGVWIDADSGLSLEVEDRQFEIPFRLISGGASFFGDARKGKRVVLTAFFVQARETTNKDFLRFCDATGWQVPEHLIRNAGFGQPEQPVTHVSQLDALRYAQWLGNKFRDDKSPAKWKCELPTEAQWEMSCRLAFPFDYPWGLNAKPTAALAARKLGAPEDAAKLTEDISIADVMGLGGNVREWCRDGWIEKATDTITPGAKDPVLGVQWDHRKVVKGGCYFSENAAEFKTFSRRAFEPDNVEKSLGFRVVVNMISKE